MNAENPHTLSLSPETFAYLNAYFSLPAIDVADIADTTDLNVWAFETVFLHPIQAYIDHYYSLQDQQTEVKLVLCCIILNTLVLEEVFEDYQQPVLIRIVSNDFHIHESLIRWWTLLQIEPEDYRYTMVSSMRAILEQRNLLSITYTFETPENLSFYYDSYKIICLESSRGIWGSIEIHNAQKDELHEHYFNVPIGKWQEIIHQSKRIGGAYLQNRYFNNKANTGNHILELHNTANELFYKLNWNDLSPNIATAECNFILKDLMLALLDIDIEAVAKQAFPIDTDLNNMSQLEIINYNAAAWDAEFKFLEEVISTRYDFHLGNSTRYRSIYEIHLPKQSPYSNLGGLIEHYSLGFEERVILALAMAVHLRPQSLDEFFTRNQKYDRTYSEAGGLKGKFHSGYLPTLETAYFLLAGKDISKRVQIFLYYFGENGSFIVHNILKLEVKEATEPHGAGQLVMSNEYLEFLTTGKAFRPSYTNNFPAELLTTELEWKDLYLEKETLAEIQNVETWLACQHKIMHELNLKKHLKLGYRALFYGSSGTGKTLTATLLGKNLGLDVYRVDLSMIASKWIGETTKNLARLFDMAENKKWILFFDEAESLFGKRSQDVQRATDAYYNQEVGYLLQRIENYDGLVVLATNLLDNIDTAFMRRFQSLVYFPVPSPTQQFALWKNIFAEGLPLSKNVNFKTLSEKYVLTASNITNVLRDVTIKTLQSKEEKIMMKTLTEAVERELKKANLRESVGFKR